MAEDALFYGDYCYSYYQAEDWCGSFQGEVDGPSYLGYTDDVTHAVCCQNMMEAGSWQLCSGGRVGGLVG